MNQNSARPNTEMDIFHILGIIWKNILLIILAAAVMGAAAFGYTYFCITPMYKATATFYVNNSTFSVGATNFSISNSELTASSNLVDTYIMVLDSRTTLNQVAEKLGYPGGYKSVSGMISAEQITGTAAFKVNVTCSDPVQAEQIANTVAEVLPERISDIIDGSSVRVVDYAIVPSGRSSPSYTGNTVKGALAGAVIACALLVLLSMLRERNNAEIGSPDDLRALFPELQVLAFIPDMRFADKKGYYYSSYYDSDNSKPKKRKEG